MAQPLSSPSDSDIEARIRDAIKTTCGRDVLDISRDSKSKNSNVYIMSIGPASGGDALSEAQPRQPGVDPMPSNALKAVMRFTNPDAILNDTVLVESAVASMMLAREALSSLPANLVPHIYGWSPARSGSTGWVLIEFMPGSHIDEDELNKLNHASKKVILTQIAQVCKLVQQYELPASMKGYGGLGFAEDGSVVVGPTPIHGATRRCEDYYELYNEYLQTQLRFMDKCDIVRGWKDSNLRARIDNFVAKGFTSVLEQAAEPHPRQTLVHADLGLANLLFDTDTYRLTAVLDFDFSHIASPADEYFYSLDGIHGLVPPPMLEDSITALRKCLLHGFDAVPADSRPEGMVNWDTAVLRDEAFRLAGVLRPVDMMPGIERLSELYWFIQNISPGLFFLPRVRARLTPEKAEMRRNAVKEDLELTLKNWGF